MSNDNFIGFDYDDLLEKFFQDGFKTENLSKILHVPISNASSCSFTIREQIFEFLNYIYVIDTNKDTFLTNIVSDLEELFNFDKCSIAKYLNISLPEFEDLIKNPTRNTDNLDKIFKFLNFFTAIRIMYAKGVVGENEIE